MRRAGSAAGRRPCAGRSAGTLHAAGYSDGAGETPISGAAPSVRNGRFLTALAQVIAETEN